MCFLPVFFVYIEKCNKSNKIRALRDVSAKKDFFAIISQRKKQKIFILCQNNILLLNKEYAKIKNIFYITEVKLLFKESRLVWIIL